ncbi:hypothetical protein POSPLADRAFT_1048859 [Postia placenta MAD-698-R-SB12]|uniref:Structural maintenance of chromosomes protein 5 n=1 Tax=Postia placenta MAD-698-R-SB12 TaxID=670580 RepID=A0A1X6MT52_9APHY|nr:hypothetical protein POSPLADRAFT_1048859 [Postia placenta MAD-698-R-SB12]OSX59547.1 hypothetical protein POSPLADRAFT_1048859 [Postia placenta MAD-698-R-SB12]
MARRVKSIASDDSQKENSSARRVNSEKAKGKMPATRGLGRRRATEEEELQEEEIAQEDDDAEGEAVEGGFEVDDKEEDEEDEQEDGASPKGRKRVRVNEEGDSRPAAFTPESKPRIQALPRDADGFIPGSIVRIQLKNFVTYDYVEFRPGPYLNMIFGPNGTGKSTIACAICLGLDFPPSIGTDNGHIEIELKSPKGKPNLVIKRTLSAKSKSSNFTLNGQSATGREINARMAELGVQVSNLCTFLPQDKVSEFAQMSSQQLLRETQRAAGNASMTSWHDTLISSGKDLKQMQEKLNSDRDQLKTMQERNANLERDVRRYEERRELEKQIELLELVFPFRQYIEAKDRYSETKTRQRNLHERVLRLQAKNAPINERKKALERELRDLDERRNQKKDGIRRKFDKIQRKNSEIEKLEAKSENAKTELENSKKAEKERVKKISTSEKTISQIREQLDNPPKVEDLDVINDDMLGLRNRMEELQSKQRRHVEQESRNRAIVDQNTRGLQQLDDASHRKLDALTNWDHDCGAAVKWLRDNRHRFKMEIFEPPMICVTVPDRRFVNAVEACFGASQLKTFVAQCEEDYQLLNRLLVDTPDAVGRRLRLHTWYRRKDESQLAPPPMSMQEMHELGFDGYAIDYVSCPEGLKWFLTTNMNLHRIAIALQPNVDPKRAMEMVSRIGPRGEGGGSSYIIGNVFNTVTRSRYGKRLPQNSTREVRPARNLVSIVVDESQKRRFEQAINEARQQLSLCEQEAQELSTEEATIKHETKELKAQHDAVRRRKETVMEVTRRLTNLGLRLERETEELAKLLSAPPVDVQREEHKKTLLATARTRAELAKECLNTIQSVFADQMEATRLSLRHCQVSANKAALENLVSAREEIYQRALKEFSDAHKLYEVAKQDSRAKLDISKAKLASVDDETRARFRDMEESGEANARSAVEIHTELEAKRAQLEMNLQTNSGVVDQYRRRQAEIDLLSNTIDEREKRAERVERTIKNARDNWQPALEGLVDSIGQKFSAAFDRRCYNIFESLGCAGEVRIRPHEDYDKWAIDILVKFRDHEKLQLLTGERQSGGERSLTTILYLMSLTEEARAPFSLVDEINQVRVS